MLNAITAADVVVSNRKPTKGKSIDIHELEDKYEIDHAFIIFSFFEVLIRLQNALKETWESYKTGTCDPMIASVVTHLAFNILRRAEDKIISLDNEQIRETAFSGVSIIGGILR